MNIEEIYIEIERLDTLDLNIKDDDLKKIAETYKLRINQIFVSLYVPLQLMERVFFHARYLRYWIEITQSSSTSREDKEAINAQILQRFSKDKVKNFEFIKNLLFDMRVQSPELEEYFQNYGFNTLVNAWTAFEATLKDIWELLLNKYPKPFLTNILKKNEVNEIEGITGKNISLGLLSKYNFNVSNSLGTILLPKYDFTSISGIKKSYSDLLSLSADEISFLNNQQLLQMEILRNLIVHNAGKVDESYLRRSKRTGEHLDEKLSLTTKELSDYFNKTIETVCNLFELSTLKINTR